MTSREQVGEADELAVNVEPENLVVEGTRHRDDLRRMLKGWR